MGQSKAEIYLHFVWTTHRRLPLMVPEIAPAVYRCIMNEAHAAKCEVLAIGGIADHVHLAVRLPTTVAPATLMQRVKGVSSALGRDHVGAGNTFGWQDGYGAFSFSRSHRERVIHYVRNQDQHHATGTLWTEWEAATWFRPAGRSSFETGR